MRRLIKLKNELAIILDKIQIKFSGKPSSSKYRKGRMKSDTYIYESGMSKEVVVLTRVDRECSDLPQQYAALETARQGFEETVHSTADVTKKRVIGKFGALDAVYTVKSSSGQTASLFMTWLTVDRWLISVALTCPDNEYALHKGLIEDIKETR